MNGFFVVLDHSATLSHPDLFWISSKLGMGEAREISESIESTSDIEANGDRFDGLKEWTSKGGEG